MTEADTPTPNDLAEQSWLWLVDLERCCGLLVGRVLGGMLLGAPPSPAEKNVGYWLETTLLSHGLERDYSYGDIGKKLHMTVPKCPSLLFKGTELTNLISF